MEKKKIHPRFEPGPSGTPGEGHLTAPQYRQVHVASGDHSNTFSSISSKIQSY